MRTIYTDYAGALIGLEPSLVGADSLACSRVEAVERDNGTWDIYSQSNPTISAIANKREKISKGLSTNEMIDRLLLIEQDINLKATKTLDIDDLTERNPHPDYIANFYKAQVKDGKYEPTLMISRNLFIPRQSNVIEIKDVDLLSQIKEDSKSQIEKTATDPYLQSVYAIREDDNSWTVFSFNAGNRSVPIGEGLNFENTKQMISAVEKSSKKPPTDAYLPHCHHSKVSNQKLQSIPQIKEQFEGFHQEEKLVIKGTDFGNFNLN